MIFDFRQQDNRRFRATEQAFLQQRDFADGFDAFERWKQQRKRLFLAVLAFAQTPYCVFVARIHQQVKPAEALDRHDFARANGVRRGQQGVERR